MQCFYLNFIWLCFPRFPHRNRGLGNTDPTSEFGLIHPEGHASLLQVQFKSDFEVVAHLSSIQNQCTAIAGGMDEIQQPFNFGVIQDGLALDSFINEVVKVDEAPPAALTV